MNRWSGLALLLAFAGAIALRVPQLDKRPLHHDEAVNALKVTQLWQHQRYAYDPDEYHGPTLHYASLPFLWLSGARTPEQLRDATLRLAPVAFGLGLLLLLLLLWDGLGRTAVIWGVMFTAVSPAMVFYSRYFIHETLLVFFTALAIGTGWRYTRARSAFWAIGFGASVGLMFATKETFVITMAAMVGAATLTALWTCRIRGNDSAARTILAPGRLPWAHLTLALSGGIVIWLLFFTSFGANWNGPVDSIRTYLPWIKRAAGHSPHIHPWYFYLERLAWFHPVKGPIWTEASVLVLAALGAAVSLFGQRASALHRFLALYTILLTAIYSFISYKTPWCLLSFYQGMILLAGVGTAALLDYFPRRSAKLVIGAVVACLTVHLAVQAWQTSVVYAADRRNPYVYAQTVPDLLKLVEKVEGIAAVAPERYDTVVKIIAPDSGYWPLPWSLRRFEHVGWYEAMPADPYAPIVISAAALDARLDEKSDRKWVMVGIFELRPGTFLELYVEFELWKKYVATLPREIE